jgi:hypothetical protein
MRYPVVISEGRRLLAFGPPAALLLASSKRSSRSIRTSPIRAGIFVPNSISCAALSCRSGPRQPCPPRAPSGLRRAVFSNSVEFLGLVGRDENNVATLLGDVACRSADLPSNLTHRFSGLVACPRHKFCDGLLKVAQVTLQRFESIASCIRRVRSLLPLARLIKLAAASRTLSAEPPPFDNPRSSISRDGTNHKEMG